MVIIDTVPHYTYPEVAELLGMSENQIRRAVIELERPYIIQELRLIPKRRDGSSKALFSLEDLKKIDTFLQLRQIKEQRPVYPKGDRPQVSP